MNIENFEDFISAIKKENAGLGQVIYPILEKYKLSKKEILEVCQIGKFVYKIDSGIKIVDKPQPPQPDFAIYYNSNLVGLEHTRIFTENADNYNRVISVIDLAQDIYEKMFPDEKVHATISIKNDKLEYKQSQKKEMATEIANFVHCYKNQLKSQIPQYISSIKTTRHSKISFSYDEYNWQGPYLTKERLKEEIEKKERKIVLYKKSEVVFSEYWLVLLVGSLSSASYQLNEYENYSTDSLFDRVYLMSDFEAEIIRIR